MIDRIETIYAGGDFGTTYEGIRFHVDFIKEYIPSRVRNRFFDVPGTNELADEFEDLVKTGFEKQVLIDVFNLEETVTYWKIGESLAECYLEDHKNIRFHYNYLRDAKNPEAYRTGADLVGFVDIGNETVFIFGEVKTSNDKSSPPRVLYGRSGMINQLEKIKGDPTIKDHLVRWLGFKVKDLSDNHPFRTDYRRALTIYIKSKKNRVKLIGILVRDTIPTERDLKSRCKNLGKDLQEGMKVEMIALYVPIPIKELGLLLYRGENDGA